MPPLQITMTMIWSNKPRKAFSFPKSPFLEDLEVRTSLREISLLYIKPTDLHSSRDYLLADPLKQREIYSGRGKLGIRVSCEVWENLLIVYFWLQTGVSNFSCLVLNAPKFVCVLGVVGRTRYTYFQTKAATCLLRHYRLLSTLAL